MGERKRWQAVNWDLSWNWEACIVEIMASVYFLHASDNMRWLLWSHTGQGKRKWRCKYLKDWLHVFIFPLTGDGLCHCSVNRNVMFSCLVSIWLSFNWATKTSAGGGWKKGRWLFSTHSPHQGWKLRRHHSRLKIENISPTFLHCGLTLFDTKFSVLCDNYGYIV